jgi:hypothetical protein
MAALPPPLGMIARLLVRVAPGVSVTEIGFKAIATFWTITLNVAVRVRTPSDAEITSGYVPPVEIIHFSCPSIS